MADRLLSSALAARSKAALTSASRRTPTGSVFAMRHTLQKATTGVNSVLALAAASGYKGRSRTPPEGHMTLDEMRDEIEAAVKGLEPPFLALPEQGWTADKLAYQRGARDAYKAVLEVLKQLKT